LSPGAVARIVRDLTCPRGTLVTTSVCSRRCARSGNREGPTSLCYTDTLRCSAENLSVGLRIYLKQTPPVNPPLQSLCRLHSLFSFTLVCQGGCVTKESRHAQNYHGCLEAPNNINVGRETPQIINWRDFERCLVSCVRLSLVDPCERPSN